MKFLILACLAFFLTLSSALATSFYARPFAEVIQASPTIVRGKTGQSYVDSGLGNDGTKRIYTYYELQVEEVFKGSVKTSSIFIREIGGEKDGRGLMVAGAAHFEPGEDVVVTLGEVNPDNSYDVRGLMSGKYSIQRDQSGQERLQSSIPPDELTRMNSGSSTDTSDDPRPTLDTLRKLVDAQARGAPASAVSQNGTVTPSQPSSRLSPTSTASQLQPPPVQGTVKFQTTKANWNYWLIAAILLGGFGIWAMTRKRK